MLEIMPQRKGAINPLKQIPANVYNPDKNKGAKRREELLLKVEDKTLVTNSLPSA